MTAKADREFLIDY